MYRKRRRYGTYSRIGRDVIGFYTDSKGRKRPITPRKGRAHLPKLYLPKIVQLPKPLVENMINGILLHTPMVKEIYTAYIIADSLYTSWNAIAQLFEEYEKGGVQSVVRRIGTETTRNAISSIQAEAIWATLGSYIPKEYQSVGKEILKNFTDTITTAEIALAKQFLQQRW